MVEAEILTFKGAIVPSLKCAFSNPLSNISRYDVKLYKTVDCSKNQPTGFIVLVDYVALVEMTPVVA